MRRAKKLATNDGWWERQLKGCYLSFIWFALITPRQPDSSRGIICRLPLFQAPPLTAVCRVISLSRPSAVLAHLIPLMVLRVMSDGSDRHTGPTFASHSNLVIKLNFPFLHIWCLHLGTSSSRSSSAVAQSESDGRKTFMVMVPVIVRQRGPFVPFFFPSCQNIAASETPQV